MLGTEVWEDENARMRRRKNVSGKDAHMDPIAQLISEATRPPLTRDPQTLDSKTSVDCFDSRGIASIASYCLFQLSSTFGATHRCLKFSSHRF